MSEEETPPSAGGSIVVPANTIDDAQLMTFADAVWPERPRERILGSWWRRADPDCAVAAVDRSGRMVGLCAGLPSTWVIGGRPCPSVAICDWFVAPDHEGKLLGRRLIRRFEAPERMMYALSISEIAAGYLNRLGWVGPYPATLMVMLVPRLMRAPLALLRRQAGLEIVEYEIVGGSDLGTLAADLDRIETRRSAGAPPHMRRGAAAWSWRLSVCGERRYRMCFARRDGEPLGYIAVRRMLPGGSRLLGKREGAIVSDIVATDDDPSVLHALAFKAVEIAAELRAAVILAATNVVAQRKALAATGFLSPGLPLLGRALQRRAPTFMWRPKGPAAALAPGWMEITFVDSDVDLAL